jgi:site-specific recombinase XerD
MPWPVTAVPFGKRPKKLPTVLSRQEVDDLIQCTENLKHRTFLMTLYAGGLRFAGAANLRIPDIDSKRMMIRIASGKGRKDRSRLSVAHPGAAQRMATDTRAQMNGTGAFVGELRGSDPSTQLNASFRQGC